MREIKIYKEFWDELETHRNHDYYPVLRKKLNTFLKRKSIDNTPVSARDKIFGSKMNELKGVWHFAISRNPDIVIFYTTDNQNVNLLMIGNHSDYPSDGKNHSARSRTGKRIQTTLDNNIHGSPEWKKISWNLPEDLIGNLDIPELSNFCKDELLKEIAEEFMNGEKYEKYYGRSLLETSEEEFMTYLDSLEKAKNEILLIRDSRLKEQYYLKRNLNI